VALPAPSVAPPTYRLLDVSLPLSIWINHDQNPRYCLGSADHGDEPYTVCSARRTSTSKHGSTYLKIAGCCTSRGDISPMIYRHASWTDPNPSATYSSLNQAQRLGTISQLLTSARAPPARRPHEAIDYILLRSPADTRFQCSRQATGHPDLKLRLPDSFPYLPTVL
jgi:hypothetical protein